MYSYVMERDSTNRRFIKQSISFPAQQFLWLKEEADRQEHGNLSRIVQDAIREYRLRRMAEQLAREPEMERVA